MDERTRGVKTYTRNRLRSKIQDGKLGIQVIMARKSAKVRVDVE